MNHYANILVGNHEINHYLKMARCGGREFTQYLDQKSKLLKWSDFYSKSHLVVMYGHTAYSPEVPRLSIPALHSIKGC